MSDDRMTMRLVIDVLTALERHGYHQRDDQHTGQAIGVIADLAHVYEGTRQAPYGTYLAQPMPPSPPEPGRSVRGADHNTVTLTGIEVSTVLTALDVAADYERDCAGTCADCADQSCSTCEWRLLAADTYDSLAAQILQAKQASPPSASPQPAPGRSLRIVHPPQPESGKEAGQ